MKPEDAVLDVETLCRLAGVAQDWLQRHVAEGQLAMYVVSENASGWRFDAVALRRVQRLARLERDFDADPELAALVADLEEEVRTLRTSLHRGPPRR